MPSRDDAPEEPAPAPDNTDLVVLRGPTKDGEGAEVIRLREGRLELGEVRPLKEGRPITGEVVGLRPRPDAPRVCDVTVHAKVPAPAPPRDDGPERAPTHKGPARVNSTAFRAGWDAVFATRDPKRAN